MRLLALYSPSLTLCLWALAWALGLRGDGVLVVGLLVLGAACAVHVREELRVVDGRAPTGVARSTRRFLRENWYRDLWLLVITGLVVWALFSQQADQNAVRLNQCDAIRADVTERTIIIRQTERPNELTRYWTGALLPGLRERFSRAQCSGRLPGLPSP